MGYEFESRREAEVPATPEQVWEAIATGPGIDSWFMGKSDVQPGQGGVVSTAFGGYTPQHEITVWEPGRRLAYRSESAADGRAIAYDFLIEGHSGSTAVRIVTSGFLPGDDWEEEFDAMTKGGALFHATLVTYLTHFAGHTARPVTAFGPPVEDWNRTWRAVHDALGLQSPVQEGATARLTPPGGSQVPGTVYFTNEHTLGVRTQDALYRFLQGFRGPLIASHNLFGDDADLATSPQAWEQWLTSLLQGPPPRLEEGQPR